MCNVHTLHIIVRASAVANIVVVLVAVIVAARNHLN